MIILGIDPGTATTGYGLVKYENEEVKALDFGSIRTSADLEPEQRLKEIHEDIKSLIDKYKPKALAIESVYFFKNAKSAIPVGQARGVAMLTAVENNLEVYEFTPLQIKMAMTGYGKAKKKQVQKMVKEHLDLEEIPKPNDAADALGAALC
ncbi:MAG: crossover junction endodeoxyribonuclease RuvC, partial [Candidatus Paceibacterota bacterium]